MKPGDLVRVVLKYHRLKGELGLLLDIRAPESPFSSTEQCFILVNGSVLKMPPSWISLVSEEPAPPCWAT
jgi:hypothetical protein